MYLAQGRIGKQESMGLPALAIVMSVVFTLDGTTAYENGNATYISLPVSVLLALGLFLLVQKAMVMIKANTVYDLCKRTLGSVGEFVAGPLIIALYMFAAWAMLERFVAIMHSIVFVTSDYAPIMFWVIATSVFLAMKGLECLARTARILVVVIGLIVLLQMIVAIEGYQFYRLTPFPTDQKSEIAMMAVERTAFAFPPLLGVLCAAPALQGMSNVKKAGIRSSIAAFIAVALIQVCTGMAFTYKELINLTIPFFRINLVLDMKLSGHHGELLCMLALLTGAILSAAYFIYSASSIYTKVFKAYDVRPATVSIGSIIASLLLLEHMQDKWGVRLLVEGIKSYAWIVLTPFIAMSIVAFVKVKRKGGSLHETT